MYYSKNIYSSKRNKICIKVKEIKVKMNKIYITVKSIKCVLN